MRLRKASLSLSAALVAVLGVIPQGSAQAASQGCTAAWNKTWVASGYDAYVDKTIAGNQKWSIRHSYTALTWVGTTPIRVTPINKVHVIKANGKGYKIINGYGNNSKSYFRTHKIPLNKTTKVRQDWKISNAITGKTLGYTGCYMPINPVIFR